MSVDEDYDIEEEFDEEEEDLDEDMDDDEPVVAVLGEADMEGDAEEGEEDPEEVEDDDGLDDEQEDQRVQVNIDTHKFEVISKDKTYERMDGRRRIGNPNMTPYELTKLIGIRSQQIASGMPPLVDVPDDIRDTKYIAIRELQLKKMPLIVRRYYPNGMYVDWRADELMLPKTILF